MCNVDRATVFRSLKKLKVLNIIEDLPEHLQPPEAKAYSSPARRILPVEQWGGTPKAPTGSGVAKCDPSQNATPLSTNSLELVSNSDEDASRKMRPNPIDLKIYRGTTSLRTDAVRGSMSQQRESTAQARQDDLDLDPTRHLGLDGESASDTKPERKRAEPGPDTGMGLANYFVNALTGALDPRNRAATVDLANRRKLAASFNRWKSQGATTEQIRGMIEVYAGDSRMRHPAKTPWVDFVGKHHLILAVVERREKAKEMETHRDDDNHWNTTEASDQRSDASRDEWERYT